MRREDAGGGGFHELFDSVRRSISSRAGAALDEPASSSFSAAAAAAGGFRERISNRLRKSRGMGLLGMPSKSPSSTRRLLPPPSPLPVAAASDGRGGGSAVGEEGGEEIPPIRWRKGDLIGSGAFGQVYLGMNLDSGELIAVKQVLIGSSNATREKAQAHVRELEDEVKMLKNLSHPNIVRYIGTACEENTLNILLEFVPGGSIQSLLGRLGSFPEAVIRKYTKQLLHGLEYLHRNGIIHRDIKGANILVDNKGCIKLADFGASKQVEKLATATAAKTMKGTPYWMAPEVIVGSGHNCSADIWSVGCTVIEMATGKPPWSHEYQEVSLLYYVGTTKSHPPIPEHLSPEAKDFLLKCLQKEPEMRSAASTLLQHPFITGGLEDLCQLNHAAPKETSNNELAAYGMPAGESDLNRPGKPRTLNSYKSSDTRSLWDLHCNDGMCQFADKDDAPMVGSSFNPMSEPSDEWESKLDISPDQRFSQSREFGGLAKLAESQMSENDFTFPCEGSCEEDDEFTESKIKEFLDEKATDLKKLQTPLYEFYNTVNARVSQGVRDICRASNITSPKLPPRAIKMVRGAAVEPICDNLNKASPNCCGRRYSRSSVESSQVLREIASPQLNKFEDKVHDDIQDKPSFSSSEIERKWKEELDQELKREREMRSGGYGKAPSPKGRRLTGKRDRSPVH
ncbi:mitogen-activated protein kinase kinase kinase NPK1-like isoform X2 [Phragmites australis]|uniref:mitogen-activated protein kinase kinase kinase NPK1-like isoform X2 n=1 Tax=Phragmites australis TaxID=29695 RepID=UPI002D77E8C5|nr:mitogen-activated protein kinase kinase kinase NPK1-like isoform X2 [Phragmites australis]